MEDDGRLEKGQTHSQTGGPDGRKLGLHRGERTVPLETPYLHIFEKVNATAVRSIAIMLSI